MPIPNNIDAVNSLIAGTDNFNTELSDLNIENIVAAAEAAMPEGAINMKDIEEKVQVNPDAELESEEVIMTSSNDISRPHIGVVCKPEGPTRSDMENAIKDIFDNKDEIDKAVASYDANTAKVSLFDIEGDKIPDIDDRTIETTANNVRDTFDLTDEEVFIMMDTLTKMRDNPKYPVYVNLPQKVQTIIAKLAYDNKVPITHLDGIARAMMDEFMKESGIDNTLIDLEKAIDEALQIPSIMDLYTDHTKNVMENIIPETAEKIKDEFPEKAEMLLKVKHAFQDSYTYARMMEEYCLNSRLRKTIRRWETEFDKVLDKFNYMNEKTNFKMNDVCHVPKVLEEVLIDNPWTNAEMHKQDGQELPELDKKLVAMDIVIEDIRKFTILLCKHCENLDPTNVIDASYMYYLVRNIIALRHTKEAKTDFSVQLINNICSVITYIRDKESEFNESNLDKSKSSKKSRSVKRNNK